MKKNTVILIIVTILLVGTGIVAWQTGVLDRFLPTGSENTNLPIATPTQKVEPTATATAIPETTIPEETIGTAAVQEDSTSEESSNQGGSTQESSTQESSTRVGTNEENSQTSETTKEEPSASPQAVTPETDSTKSETLPAYQKEIYEEMHKMINTKIIADEIWGTIEITTYKVDEVVTKVNDSDFSDKEKERLLQILNYWKNKDFSDAVNEHNYLWGKLGGNIGRATGLKTD